MKALVIVMVLVMAIPTFLTVFTKQLETFQMPVETPQPKVSISMTRVPVPAIPSGWLDAAMSWLGTPYLWGGCGKRGIDCSCFVQNVLAVVGINAPRTTTTQVRWARPISRDDLRPMDLVFFNDTCDDCGANPTHVGLYIGNGQMIQSGSSGVSIQPVFSGFYGPRFASGGRVP